jgi:3-oxoadipate enol-lactonase
VRAEGTGVLVEPTRARWFTAETQRERPQEVERVMAMLAATPAEGYARCCEALATYDTRDRLPSLGVPTLVIAGSEDPTAGPDSARELAGGIPGADLMVLEGAAHLAHLARPDEFTAAVRRHLSRHAPQAR